MRSDPDGDLIAVLHKYPDVGEKALGKVKAKFDIPESNLDENNIFDHLLKVAPEGESVAEGGSLANGKNESSTIVEETYLDGYKAHATIEPHTATVKIEGNKVTVWPFSQTPFRAKEEVTEALGISRKMSGSFLLSSVAALAVNPGICRWWKRRVWQN